MPNLVFFMWLVYTNTIKKHWYSKNGLCKMKQCYSELLKAWQIKYFSLRLVCTNDSLIKKIKMVTSVTLAEGSWAQVPLVLATLHWLKHHPEHAGTAFIKEILIIGLGIGTKHLGKSRTEFWNLKHHAAAWRCSVNGAGRARQTRAPGSHPREGAGGRWLR